MKKIFNDFDMFKREVNHAAYRTAVKLYVKNDGKKVWAIDCGHARARFVTLLELNKPIGKDVLVELYKASVCSERSIFDKDKSWEQIMDENVTFVKDIKR